MSNTSFADDDSDLLNQLVGVFKSCKEADIQKKTYFFSRNFLAYRLGAILSKNQNDLANSIAIAKNTINICSQVDDVERFVLEGSDSEPALKVFYKKPNNSEVKILSLVFIKENELWLIERTEECCINLKH